MPKKAFDVSCLLLTFALLTRYATAIEAAAKPPNPTVPEGQKRSPHALQGGPMHYFPDRADAAVPLVATFIGGPGPEWLVGGGFLPDGTVLLVGNVQGGVFDLGTKATVLGADATRPPEARIARRKVACSEFKDNCTEREVYDAPGWLAEDVTGFLVRCSPDLQKIVTVVRLPWSSGAITAVAVAPDGALYLAGRSGKSLGNLGNIEKLAVGAGSPKGDCRDTFMAKVEASLGKISWVKRSEGPSDSPFVRVLRNGNVACAAQDMRVFDPAGRQLSSVEVPGGVRAGTSVNPVDGTIACGGDHNWATGRQPYRSPYLKVYGSDGRLLHHLYDWGGPYVVVDRYFLVSDTSVRRLWHDDDGNLLAVLWSDGGNSVGPRQPNDVRSVIPCPGLGLTAAGAGATSFAYLARIEPSNYQATAYSIWCSRWGRKGNGASIDVVKQDDEGGFLFAGGSAWGLYQTGNKLANGEPAGCYIAAATPDLTGVRFCSTVPGAGKAAIGSGVSIGVAHGRQGGRSRALFVCGAEKEGTLYGLTTPTPLLNPLQKAFGGGVTDGYAVLLDLPPLQTKREDRATSEPLRLTPALHASPKGQPARRTGSEPPAGTVYQFSPNFPRWTVADAEFRDSSGKRWPNFLYGRNVSGSIKWDPIRPEGAFAVACPNWCQTQGDQNRRVLGGLFVEGKPPKVGFAVTAINAAREDEFARSDRNGKPQTLAVTAHEAKAELTLGDRAIPVTAQLVIRQGRVTESQIEKLDVTAYFTVKGAVLGLTGDLRDTGLDACFTMQGHVIPSSGKR
jgi:hypothetical protein